MLVVVVIILALLAAGVVSFHALTARSQVRMASQSAVNVLRWAREYAITHHTRCLAEIVAINDNTAARPTAPGTPYVSAVEGTADKLRVVPLRAIRSDTGAYSYVVTPAVLKELPLPAQCVFDDERGSKRCYPENAPLPADLDEDGSVDTGSLTRVFFEFNSDGACVPQTAGQEACGNTIRIKDLLSGETETIAVMPNTGLTVSARP